MSDKTIQIPQDYENGAADAFDKSAPASQEPQQAAHHANELTQPLEVTRGRRKAIPPRGGKVVEFFDPSWPGDVVAPYINR